MSDAGTQSSPQTQTISEVQATPPTPQPQQVSLELSLLIFVLGTAVFSTYLLRMIRPTLKSDPAGAFLAGFAVMAAMLFLTGGQWVIALMYAVPAVGLTAILFDLLDRKTVLLPVPPVTPVQKE